MRRLFNKFEKETEMVSAIYKKNTPMTLLVKTRKYESKTVEIDRIAQISSAFYQYLNHRWETIMSKGKPTWGKVSKAVVRKWVAKMAVERGWT